ncbi:MAG: GNAT family N-acetyltransferase [Phycisphaerae bacterium]|nr:GNAT family N-acetyltransferase [Phycisphaerae bacterium]
MWIEPTTLRGMTVRLEPLDARHAPDLLAAAEPELFRFTPQAPPEWSVAGFERDIARVSALPNVVAFAIVLNGSGRAVGRTTYMDIRADSRGVEIGRTWIARAHQGTRVNPEIKYLMLRHAFETLAPTAVRVEFKTGGTNRHSQSAIAKLGAVKEGVFRKHRIVPGGPDPAAPPVVRDTVVFSIVDDEWPAVKRGLEMRLK